MRKSPTAGEPAQDQVAEGAAEAPVAQTETGGAQSDAAPPAALDQASVAPDEEQPQRGGSFIRHPGGALEQIEGFNPDVDTPVEGEEG